MAAAIGDDGHCFPIVSCKHPFDHAVASGVKANTVADAEFQHLGMRTHLLQRTKPLDDPVIQVDELASLSRSMSIFVICHPRMEEVVIGDKLAGIISPADHR